MFRLETVSPMLVAWAVSLGLGGLLLFLFLSGDATEVAPTVKPVVAGPRRQPNPPVVAGPAAAPEPERITRPRPVVADAKESQPVVAPVQKPTVKSPSANPAVRPKSGEKAPLAKPVKHPQPDAGVPRAVAKPKPPSRPEPRSRLRSAREIREALKLPIKRYVHQGPVKLRQVLREVGQLGGVDLRIDKSLVGDSRLEKIVELDLKKTSAGGILDAALESTGLTHQVHDGYVLIVLTNNGAASLGPR